MSVTSGSYWLLFCVPRLNFILQSVVKKKYNWVMFLHRIFYHLPEINLVTLIRCLCIPRLLSHMRRQCHKWPIMCIVYRLQKFDQLIFGTLYCSPTPANIHLPNMLTLINVTFPGLFYTHWNNYQMLYAVLYSLKAKHLERVVYPHSLLSQFPLTHAVWIHLHQWNNLISSQLPNWPIQKLLTPVWLKMLIQLTVLFFVTLSWFFHYFALSQPSNHPLNACAPQRSLPSLFFFFSMYSF